MNFNATLFGQLLAFVFFVWFTMQYVWPYILAALEEREKEISDGLEAASRHFRRKLRLLAFNDRFRFVDGALGLMQERIMTKPFESGHHFR